MKTSIIGGGKGCRAILELAVQGRLKKLDLDIQFVVDPNPDSSGMKFARKHGWKTASDIGEALSIPGLELVIELTGRDEILEEIYRLIPPGVMVMDHTIARVFWDLDLAEQNLRQELREKEELEIQLEGDRRQLQKVLDGIPDIVMVVDREKRIARVNAIFSKVTGLTHEEALGKYCHDIFCMGYKDLEEMDSFCPFETVMKTGKRSALIQTRTRSDGTQGYYEVTANPIYDRYGKIIQVVETSHPITEQVRMRRETEESEKRFRAFINMAQDLISIKDLEGNYLVINPKAAAYFGRSTQDFIGKKDNAVLPRAIASLFARHDQDVKNAQGYLSFEEVIHLNGRERFLSSTRFPLQNFKGDIIGICNIARDITEQKNLQQELVNAEKMAAMGKLAAGVAHEINNPLTGVVTFAEDLMEESGPGDRHYEDYKLIYHEAMRCRQIVRDMLDFSRLEKPKRKLMNVNQVIQRAVGMVANQATFRNIRFDMNLGRDIPELLIDSNQIQQVMLNLIINAAQAMDNSGRIVVGSERRDELGSVGISVIDEGCGILPKNIKRIFEPFFTTKGSQGNGLGLTAVKSILEHHSGNIGVDSEVGEGTTFVVALPYPHRDAEDTE